MGYASDVQVHMGIQGENDQVSCISKISDVMYMMFPLCVLWTIVVSSMLVKAFFCQPFLILYLPLFFHSLPLLSKYMQTTLCKGESEGATMEISCVYKSYIPPDFIFYPSPFSLSLLSSSPFFFHRFLVAVGCVGAERNFESHVIYKNLCVQLCALNVTSHL